MIETIVLNYLKAQSTLSGKDILMETKSGMTSQYVILEKTGSKEKDHIKTATIAVQSYAPSMYEAATLNETVKTAMEGITSLASVSRCECNSDYNFTDTTKKVYRYQAVYDLVYTE